MKFSLISSTGVREVIIVLGTIIIALLLNVLLRSFIKVPPLLNPRRRKIYVTVLRNLITVVLVYIALHVIFVVLGINITPLLASAGIIGIVVGIGAQSFVKDLIAGFFLVSQSSVTVGDFLLIAKGVEGTVVNMGLKNMTLVGQDGSLIIVPNGQVNIITNLTHGKVSNRIDVTIKFLTEVDKILDVFENTLDNLKTNKAIKVYPESRIIGIKNIAVMGITVSVLLVTPYYQKENVQAAFHYALLKEFEKKEINYS